MAKEAHDVPTSNDGRDQQLVEKSLLGSSYSYQQGTAQATNVTVNELAQTDDD